MSKSPWIITFKNMRLDMNKPLETITRLIQTGHVVMTYKTKWRDQGGKQFVSVGPYRTAIKDGSKRYAVISGIDEAFFGFADQAAKDFIQFVGRDIARQAIRDTITRGG